MFSAHNIYMLYILSKANEPEGHGKMELHLIISKSWAFFFYQYNSMVKMSESISKGYSKVFDSFFVG